MDTRYFCKNEGRRLLIIDSDDFNGIDFLEVTSTDQRTLSIHFLNDLPGQVNGIPAAALPLTKENIKIEGGVRIQDITVEEEVIADGKILTVRVNQAGDFSNYQLCIVSGATDDNPPTGFDAPLSKVTFSFKANCPSDFDCKTTTDCPPDTAEEPRINYLAKDFSSFRRVMLDRLSLLLPEPQERNTTDLQVALVELLAYAGDHMSYYQDAVATEAYLFKARKRPSIRRHARLLDYHMHNGTNARVWVHLMVEPGGTLDNGTLEPSTRLLTGDQQSSTLVNETLFERLLQQEEILIFETMHEQNLHSSHNEIQFYTWGDSNCCLPKGSTEATLRNPNGGLQLARYDVLIFEEVISPTTGQAADANPLQRHPVRLITDPVVDIDPLTNESILRIKWHEEDTLPFPLCLSAEVEGVPVPAISIARGNIVLADHGLTVPQQSLLPANHETAGHYRPRLQHNGLSFVQPYEHDQHQVWPANQATRQLPQEAIPAIYLQDDTETWIAQRDLLNSDRFAKEFVAEMDEQENVMLRFGDNLLGEQPGIGFAPLATYRLGSGSKGNTGRDSIRRIVINGGGILAVRNPLAASGGKRAESMEEVRQFAPEAFRIQERAVTEADYATKTRLHPEVQNAVAQFRWTGSWHTVYITVDRLNGRPVNEDFKERIYHHLEKYRMAGYDLEIRSPLFVSLEISMEVCVKPGYFRDKVHQQLLKLFSNQVLSYGDYGFFHPDNFTFGQPLYVSKIYEKAMQVEGVASIELRRFQRRGIRGKQHLRKGRITAGFTEIFRLDNDPNFPENGWITFSLSGGL